MDREIIVGAVAAILASLITWIVACINENLSDHQLKLIAEKIIYDEAICQHFVKEFKANGGSIGEGRVDRRLRI